VRDRVKSDCAWVNGVGFIGVFSERWSTRRCYGPTVSMRLQFKRPLYFSDPLSPSVPPSLPPSSLPNRYLAEFQNGDVRKESAAKALEAYSSASSIATSDLPPTHPIRLGNHPNPHYNTSNTLYNTPNPDYNTNTSTHSNTNTLLPPTLSP
jgi:hypothetical protein